MKKKAAPQQKLPAESKLLTGNRPLLLLLLLSFLLYLPTLWYDFSPLDERWLIVKQLGIMKDISNLPLLFKSAVTGMYYRPALMSTFMIDASIGKGAAGIFHFTNVLLHALSVLLLFRLLLKLEIKKTAAFMFAALFAAHPLAVHAVAWIPGRNDSLLCVFALLSCIQLLNYFSSKKNIHLVIHFTAFLFALLTKENAVVLVPLYALLWWFLKKEKDTNGFVIMLGGWVALFAGWFIVRSAIVYSPSNVAAASTGTNVLHFLEGLAVFAGKTFLPVQQSVMAVLQDAPVFLFTGAVVVIAALVFKFKFHDRKIAWFGVAWFFAFLILPVWYGATSTNQDLYEHRVYTSMIGAFLFLSQLKFPLSASAARAGFAIVLVLFSIRTFTRVPAYKDSLSFLEAATKESPSIPIMHDMLGYKYNELKNYTAARESYDEAIRLNPNRDQFYNHRGNMYYQTKNYTLALADFNKTLALNDTQAITYVNRSMTNFYLGRHSTALDDLKLAQEKGANNIPPDYVQALYESFQTDTIKLFTAKIQMDSTDASLYNTRGIAKMRLGLFKEALDDFNRALFLRPNSAAIKSNQQVALSNLQQSKKR